jgi:hypothetical protein
VRFRREQDTFLGKTDTGHTNFANQQENTAVQAINDYENHLRALGLDPQQVYDEKVKRWNELMAAERAKVGGQV